MADTDRDMHSDVHRGWVGEKEGKRASEAGGLGGESQARVTAFCVGRHFLCLWVELKRACVRTSVCLWSNSNCACVRTSVCDSSSMSQN